MFAWPLSLDVSLRETVDLLAPDLAAGCRVLGEEQGGEEAETVAAMPKTEPERLEFFKRVADGFWTLEESRAEMLQRLDKAVPKKKTLWKIQAVSPEEAVEHAIALRRAVSKMMETAVRRSSVLPQPSSFFYRLFTRLLVLRMRLLVRLNTAALRAVPLVASVFNSPNLGPDFHGLLTGDPVVFLRGPSRNCLPWLHVDSGSPHTGRESDDILHHNFGLGSREKIKEKSWVCRSSRRMHLRRSEKGGRSGSPASRLASPSHATRCDKRDTAASFYAHTKMVVQAGPADLPAQLSVYLFMRPLLTSETITSLWGRALERVGVPSHDIPALRLDRGLAATAKNILHSMLYQATVQLLASHMNPNKLRGRPGDRPFMVVFKGEGATDFGGPFQEFLSCIAREIMGSLADAPDGGLPNFSPCLPCPNATHAIGPHQDTVLLRPDDPPYNPEPQLYFRGEIEALQENESVGTDEDERYEGSEDEGSDDEGRSGSKTRQEVEGEDQIREERETGALPHGASTISDTEKDGFSSDWHFVSSGESRSDGSSDEGDDDIGVLATNTVKQYALDQGESRKASGAMGASGTLATLEFPRRDSCGSSARSASLETTPFVEVLSPLFAAMASRNQEGRASGVFRSLSSGVLTRGRADLASLLFFRSFFPSDNISLQTSQRRRRGACLPLSFFDPLEISPVGAPRRDGRMRRDFGSTGNLPGVSSVTDSQGTQGRSAAFPASPSHSVGGPMTFPNATPLTQMGTAPLASNPPRLPASHRPQGHSGGRGGEGSLPPPEPRPSGVPSSPGALDFHGDSGGMGQFRLRREDRQVFQMPSPLPTLGHALPRTAPQMGDSMAGSSSAATSPLSGRHFPGSPQTPGPQTGPLGESGFAVSGPGGVGVQTPADAFPDRRRAMERETAPFAFVSSDLEVDEGRHGRFSVPAASHHAVGARPVPLQTPTRPGRDPSGLSHGRSLTPPPLVAGGSNDSSAPSLGFQSQGGRERGGRSRGASRGPGPNGGTVAPEGWPVDEGRDRGFQDRSRDENRGNTTPTPAHRGGVREGGMFFLPTSQEEGRSSGGPGNGRNGGDDPGNGGGGDGPGPSGGRRDGEDRMGQGGLDKDTERRAELAMYEALGRLLAMCSCIGAAFNASLNPLIWKKLVGQPLQIQDLADSDCVAVEMLRSLRRLAAVPPSLWDEAMEASISDLTFMTEGSSGQPFELVQGGSEIVVTPKNLELFIRLSERCRLLEGQGSLEALLKGIGAVLPLGRMRMLFDWRRLEYRVCGDRVVDLDLLRSHTACGSEELKATLFEVLETFTNDQLQRFLRFVSGRSRLPSSGSDWRMAVDYEIPEGQRVPPIDDNRLPTAATCGFRLLLPRYTSNSIFRQRLLYAINNCTAIDLDAYVVHEQMTLMYED
ncbi:HECT-domain (ubiquitin-transferase) domain-containing protein [Toxoplasma gondii p89]|uniref:HECT-domain (Ubiquitin-transferase) domain-containing protein n=1 Tax=Toxoplasma gondii p89 TaxID=943119 RepID=A0A086JAX6_TOXGO|nr:HECT-domain (ubiquitin-transferase) domain-containing protein [Toxoplasma gondii p89]